MLRKLGEVRRTPPNPKYIPKPYEKMLYPGQRVQVDVKVVPTACIVGDAKGERFYQYTAIEEYYPQIKISHGLAVAMGSIPACIFQGQSPDGMIDFFHTYGIDFNPESYGITPDMFEDMWLKARTVRQGRITILSEIDHDRAQLDDIYNRMVEG